MQNWSLEAGSISIMSRSGWKKDTLKPGDTRFDPTTQCKPMGLPRTAYDGWPFEILQNEQQLLFGYTWNRMVRFVPVDRKGHIRTDT